MHYVLSKNVRASTETAVMAPGIFTGDSIDGAMIDKGLVLHLCR